jgi:hypothetical protein
LFLAALFWIPVLIALAASAWALLSMPANWKSEKDLTRGGPIGLMTITLFAAIAIGGRCGPIYGATEMLLGVAMGVMTGPIGWFLLIVALVLSALVAFIAGDVLPVKALTVGLIGTIAAFCVAAVVLMLPGVSVNCVVGMP